jgi:uncharacterized membrane protein YukC
MNRKKEAIRLLDKMLQNINPKSYPHDDLSLYMVEAYYHAGALEKAATIARILADNARQDMVWINDLSETQKNASMNDLQRDQALLERLYQTAKLACDIQTANYLSMSTSESLPLLNNGMISQ